LILIRLGFHCHQFGSFFPLGGFCDFFGLLGFGEIAAGNQQAEHCDGQEFREFHGFIWFGSIGIWRNGA